MVNHMETETITAILERAHKRAEEMDLPYQGALLPTEALTLLQEAPEAKLVDVRSRAEWDWVGRIPGAVEIEWQSYPGMRSNPDFINYLSNQVDQESLVMFICRTGGRSHQAAATASELGYTNCYNVLEGFEGEKDATGHRGKKGGWKAAGLPWVQS
ncbi:thiosulfate sulfurtransferase [Nitrosospira multiformis]|uniref:Thiosulfate sulfurtransferase n=2 Tax=Nitrosospira multiformis TaxID=1231 RepID=A0A1I7IDQ0_9PROT|nr:thiosulfate sulfurtransferase [Nitrosospira multiformis]